MTQEVTRYIGFGLIYYFKTLIQNYKYFLTRYTTDIVICLFGFFKFCQPEFKKKRSNRT